MKKRRVSAAVLIGSANGRCLNIGFGALYYIFVVVLACMFVLVLSIARDQVVALQNVASDFCSPSVKRQVNVAVVSYRFGMLFSSPIA
jgi:hypothetical protein